MFVYLPTFVRGLMIEYETFNKDDLSPVSLYLCNSREESGNTVSWWPLTLAVHHE